MSKKGKVRTIYSNYNLSNYFDETKEFLIEETAKEPSDVDIWEEIFHQDQNDWENTKEYLFSFFHGGTWILHGVAERWDGKYRAGTVFTDVIETFRIANIDCDFIHIYDINGHFYLKCSHHDGTNLYEIKKLTDRGIRYFENWEESDITTDLRSKEHIYNKLMDRYSILPHFAHKVFGCPKVEYKTEAC